MIKEANQSYRANIAGIIVNKKNEFLFVQLIDARPNEWDFVKGGMHPEESELDTLKREIKEEIGENNIVEVIQRSNVQIVYEWPEELQKRKGFRGQARVSYWVKYISGEITIMKEELQSYKWFPESELKQCLISSGFPAFITDSFIREWNEIKHEF